MPGRCKLRRGRDNEAALIMLDDEQEFEFSPFTGTVKDDGVTVELRIYRFASPDEQWQLEVIDHEGGLTSWEELFETDGAAFEAFL